MAAEQAIKGSNFGDAARRIVGGEGKSNRGKSGPLSLSFPATP